LLQIWMLRRRRRGRIMMHVQTIVQWVRTSWTKRSRGGPGSIRRNRAPVAFELPPVAPPLVHEVTMREQDDFVPCTDTRADPVDGSLVLRELDGRLRVELVVTPWGMPLRRRRPAAVLLLPGEWVRWQVNYRFTGGCDGDWSYRLDTLNLACGPVPADAFLGEPTRYVDERAYLR
jgi:hypothetical protein